MAPVVSRFFFCEVFLPCHVPQKLGSFGAVTLEALDPSSAERFLQLVDERLGPQAEAKFFLVLLLGMEQKMSKVSVHPFSGCFVSFYSRNEYYIHRMDFVGLSWPLGSPRT